MKIDNKKALVEHKSNNSTMLPINRVFQRLKEFFELKHKKEDKSCNTIEGIQDNFIDSLKVEESEEAKLFKLQRKYRNGELKEEDLSEEQITKLIELYDRQIESKEKENKIKRNKIKRLKMQN